jgi:glycosyltransferase involved in cell wall biosynthesis/phosphoheptose isomerase
MLHKVRDYVVVLIWLRLYGGDEMRVAMVSEHASPLVALGGVDAGGQNVHVASLAVAMGRRGVEVVVYTRRDDPSLPQRVRLGPWVTVEHLDAGPPEKIPKDDLLPYMEDLAEELRRAWTAWRPDVVHSHFWMSGKASLSAARPLGVPVAHTFHALGVVKRRYQGQKDTSPPERLEEERRIVRHADRIVATCTDEMFELLRLGADPRRISVVPCGVDLDLFVPDGPAEERSPGLHRVVVVSRLVERKGVGNVISALAEVPDTELVVAGGPDASELDEDPEARRLRNLARAEGVEGRVHLRGRLDRESVPALLRSADVAVSVPWYEPFGIVPLEAMACGIPVIASSVGGQVDTVVDGVTGVHVPPRSPDRLAEALGELLSDPERRRSLGAAAARHARSRYGWDRVARATLEAYLEPRQATRPTRKETLTKNMPSAPTGLPTGLNHLAALRDALSTLESEVDRIDGWGRHLAEVLTGGGRLLAAGNGGSAALAQHLTSELVGRYRDDRCAFSALSLHTEASCLTSIANDYGAEEVFARQVRAHGRPGDVLVALSTSGKSSNVLAAVEAARDCGMTAWALTGCGSNPLSDGCDDAVCVEAPSTATVQEVHQVIVHLLCAAVDCAVGASTELRLPEEAVR